MTEKNTISMKKSVLRLIPAFIFAVLFILKFIFI